MKTNETGFKRKGLKMNLIEAIEAVKKDNTKVYEAEYGIKGMRIEYIEFKGIEVDGCDRVGFEVLPDIMQLDFHEVVDWSKVKVDTRIISVLDDSHWHFAKYENGNVYAYPLGTTSWTWEWFHPLSKMVYFDPADVRLAEEEK